MKRTLEQVDPTLQDSSDYGGQHVAVQQVLVTLRDYKCLVTTATQTQLAYLSGLASPQVLKRTQCLLELSKSILLLNTRDQAHVVTLLLNRLENERRNDLKVMIILVLQKVSLLPHVNPILLLGHLVAHLNSKSAKVRCQLYKAITNILKVRQVIVNSTTENQLYNLLEHVLSELSEPHHRIRSECVRLLPVLSKVFINYDRSASVNTKTSEMEIQSIISNYALDADPRVRKSALNALVEMHLCGTSLDQPLYYLAVQSLSDDFEEVRLQGLDLIWSLCSSYPDYSMPLANELVKEKVRLIDDAFSRVCDLVNDVSVVVRTKACVMLASYHDVEADILAQTFTKRIMSRLRRKIPSKNNSGNNNANSNNSSTKSMTPKKVEASGDFSFDSDEFRILDSGACGAFIHGLEDEYQEVRSAAIDSICELCMYHGSLIKPAVLCLVDMFNDEIDNIRINAIQSLRKIGSKTTLKFDSEELEVALGAFEDSDRIAREAAHGLMKVTRLSNGADLEKLLLALMANAKRYPEDKLSILRCLCEVGKRHDDFVEYLVPSLLRLDKRYLAREQPVTDFIYTSNVILVTNACINNQRVLSFLPQHMVSHVAYYKRKYPDCVPDLQVLWKSSDMQATNGSSHAPTQVSLSMTDAMLIDVEEYISITMSMLVALHHQVKVLDFTSALTTLNTAKRNFEYISTLDTIHAETSFLAILYLQCYEIVINARKNQTSTSYASTAQSAASSLLQYSYKMQYSFLGLPTQTLQAAMYFRLLANLIWIFGILKQFPITTSSPGTIRNMLNALIFRVDIIQKHFTPGLSHCSAIADLRSNLLKAAEHPTTSNMALLYSFIIDFLPLDVKLETIVKRAWATITFPTSNPDEPVKFDPVFPMELKIEADLTHTLDVSQIGIEIILPDQSSLFFWPSSSQFVPTHSDCHKLLTSVTLSLSSWKEPDALICRIVRAFDPDLPGLDHCITKPSAFLDTRSKDLPSIPIVQRFSTIVISDHLLLHLFPVSSL